MLIQCFTGDLNMQDSCQADRRTDKQTTLSIHFGGYAREIDKSKFVNFNRTLHKITVKSAANVIARVIKNAFRDNLVWPRGGHQRLEAAWR